MLKNSKALLVNKQYNLHGIKKSMDISLDQRMHMIENNNRELSVAKQCDMLNIARSSYYNCHKESTTKDAEIIKCINTIYDQRPAYGSRRITEILQRQGIRINRKKTQRLMRIMKIQGVYPKRNLSIANQQHKKYPYIARDNPIVRIDQVWSSDITYVKTKFGIVYLVAIIDWYSRIVLSWNMSNGMNEEFCVEALERSLTKG